MGTFSGYALEHRIYRSPSHVVYRGHRTWSGQPVIAKCLVARFPSPHDLARLRHEYSILQLLDGRGAPRAVAFEQQDQGVALISEDTGGQSLESLLQRGPLDAGAFLDIAIACCDALAHVHGSGILHRDISPANIVIDPDGAARFIDFAFASKATDISTTPDALPLLEGTPATMAPEQTGRMNRCVDHRSDFYSLGATFYYLLTARLPFTGDDTLDLILAHVSRPPDPPHLHNPKVPLVLSALVLKLLSKSADERYQSLRGLRSDLDLCRETLLGTRNLPSGMVLGAHDSSEQFRLPQRLYGRDRPLAILLDALDRVAGLIPAADSPLDPLSLSRLDSPAAPLLHHCPELVLISGSSGIGKTVLTRELVRPLNALRGLFVSGKFEEFRRNTPYAAIIDAFAHHMRSLLSGSEQDLGIARNRLTLALAGQGSLMTEVIPELEIIIGPQPPLPAVETENRFTRVFRAFISAIAGPEQLLLLVLDDMQWADRSSLHLVQQLLMPGEQRAIMVVGTCRSDEVDSNHPLTFLLDRLRSAQVPVTDIPLAPLDDSHMTALLADTLGTTPQAVVSLAALCADKTRGNPFFLTRFLSSLHDAGLIFYDHSRHAWDWQEDAISRLDITDNVVDLMVEKLSRLSPSCHRVLQRAACIGSTFDLATLSRINDVSPEATMAQLWESLREGLVLPLSEAWRAWLPGNSEAGSLARLPAWQVRFRFQHDRVHQATYGQIPSEDRALRHLNIGRTLLETASGAELSEHLFDIVDQLNRGREHIGDDALRQRVAHLNLEAARKARASAANASALAYVREGLACLPADSWQGARALTLDLYTEGADAAFTLADVAGMQAFIGEINQHSTDALEKAKTLEIEAIALTLAHDNTSAIEPSLKALEELGYPLPRRVGRLKRMLALLRCRHEFARARQSPPVPGRPPDPRTVAALRILNAVCPAISFSRPDLLPSTIAAMLALPHETGDTVSLSNGLAAYTLMTSALGKSRTALQAASLAHSFTAATIVRTELSERAEFVALYHGLHWQHPLRTLRDHVRDIIQRTVGNGIVENMGYYAAGYVSLGVHAGVDLDELDKDVALGRELAQRMNNIWSQPYVTCIGQMIENLTVPREDPVLLVGSRHDETVVNQKLLSGRNMLLLTAVLSVRMLLGLVFRRMTVVREAGATIGQHSWTIRGTPIGVAVEFYEALAWCHDQTAGPLPRRLARAQLAVKRFRRWVAVGEANTLHRYQALQAEVARLSNHTLKAAELYDVAIKTAHDNGFSHEEAIINELAADFHDLRGRPMIALAYRRQAHYRWLLWGASARALAMEEEWPELADGDASDAMFPHQSALHQPAGPPGGGGQAGTRPAQGAHQAGNIRPGSLPGTGGTATDGLHHRRNEGRITSNSGLDLAAVMKAAQAISGEIHRPALMENLLRITMGVAGAQRGLLLLRNGDNWTLEAEGEASADRFTLHRTAVPLDRSERSEHGGRSDRGAGGERSDRGAGSDSADGGRHAAPLAIGQIFSRPVFNYAARTREAVVLNNAMEDGPFVSDPYLTHHKVRSVLCLPLFQQADMRGMLYLENNLTPGAFTSDRLEVLRLLAAQVVISLDNAVLYENLSTLNRHLEAEVAERTREATEKSALLEATLDNMSDGLVAYDADSRLLVWNERVIRLFDIPRPLCHPGASPSDIAHAILAAGTLTPRLAAIVAQRLAEGGDPFPDKANSEIEMSDGRFVQMRRTTMPDGGQVQVYLDVTEERRRERELVSARTAAEKALSDLQEAQKSLIQAEKMASLGQLVAGVAHEINTPVGITLTASSFLSERAHEMHLALNGAGIRRSQLQHFIDQAVETTDLMLTNIHRAADLIHSFKQVAVDQTSGEKRLFILARYLDEVLRSFGPTLRKTPHSFTIDCPGEIEVESYPGALSQILTNFTMNALAHAFPDGMAGQITVAARLQPGSSPDLDMIELRFSDNGQGVPREYIDRVFDPFFTTRRGSGGSGLGLNIVYNLVTGMLKGTIAVESIVGKGATFVVRFPRIAPAG